MAFSVTSISVLNSTANTATYTPGAFTPTANRLIVMWVKASKPTAGGVLDPTLTTNPLGFTKVTSILITQTNTNDNWLACYVALSGATPPVGTPVLDFSSSGANMSGCQINIWEVDGADISGTAAAAIIQSPSASGTGTTRTITLSAAADSLNRPAAAFHDTAQQAATPRTNWTEITDQLGGSPNSGLETQWRSDAFETTASASWANSIIRQGIAIEMKVASSAVNATATPSTVAAVAAVPAPTILAAANVAPAAVAGIGAVPAPTILTGGDVIATPAVVAGVGAVPAPSVLAAAISTPATVAAVGAVPAPSVQAAAIAVPGAVAAVAAIPPPSVHGAALVTPATVVTIGAIPTPTPAAGATATPSTVAAAGAIPAPNISAGAIATPATVVVLAAVPAVTITTTTDPQSFAFARGTHVAAARASGSHRRAS